MSDVEHPEGQDPTTPAVEITGPWAGDITSTFEDPAIAQQVAAFMAEKYQPYVTKLEQERKQYAEFASRFEDNEQVGDAFLDLTTQIFGAEVTEQLLDFFAGQSAVEEEEDVPVIEGTTEEEPMSNEDLEWLTQFRAEQEEHQMTVEYERDKAAWLAENAPDIDSEAFDVFVAQTEGDFDLAKAAYENFASRFAPAQEPGETPPVPVPGNTGAVPPTQKRYTSFDDAWNDMMAEMKGAAPPTV